MTGSCAGSNQFVSPEAAVDLQNEKWGPLLELDGNWRHLLRPWTQKGRSYAFSSAQSRAGGTGWVQAKGEDKN